VKEDPNLAVVGVALGGVIGVAVAPERWDFYDTMIGILLIAILFVYGNYSQGRSAKITEIIVLAATTGFCVLLILGVAIQAFSYNVLSISRNSQIESVVFLVIWIVLSFAIAKYMDKISVILRRFDRPL
jgi:hypothetical protein